MLYQVGPLWWIPQKQWIKLAVDTDSVSVYAVSPETVLDHEQPQWKKCLMHVDQWLVFEPKAFDGDLSDGRCYQYYFKENGLYRCFSDTNGLLHWQLLSVNRWVGGYRVTPSVMPAGVLASSVAVAERPQSMHLLSRFPWDIEKKRLPDDLANQSPVLTRFQIEQIFFPMVKPLLEVLKQESDNVAQYGELLLSVIRGDVYSYFDAFPAALWVTAWSLHTCLWPHEMIRSVNAQQFYSNGNFDVCVGDVYDHLMRILRQELVRYAIRVPESIIPSMSTDMRERSMKGLIKPLNEIDIGKLLVTAMGQISLTAEEVDVLRTLLYSECIEHWDTQDMLDRLIAKLLEFSPSITAAENPVVNTFKRWVQRICTLNPDDTIQLVQKQVIPQLIDRLRRVVSSMNQVDIPRLSPAVKLILLRGCIEADTTNPILIHLAARANSSIAIRELHGIGVDINQVDARGWVALHHAASVGSVDAINELVWLGLNVNARDHEGCAPLHYAVEVGELRVVRALQRAGADMNARDKEGFAPLHCAIRHHQAALLGELVALGSDLAITVKGGVALLHFAAVAGYVDVMEVLIGLGMTPDVLDETNQTVLHYAALRGRVSVINWLMAQGIEWRKKNSLGEGPLDVFPARDINEKHYVEQVFQLCADFMALYTDLESLCHRGGSAYRQKMGKASVLYRNLSRDCSVPSLQKEIQQYKAEEPSHFLWRFFKGSRYAALERVSDDDAVQTAFAWFQAYLREQLNRSKEVGPAKAILGEGFSESFTAKVRL